MNVNINEKGTLVANKVPFETVLYILSFIIPEKLLSNESSSTEILAKTSTNGLESWFARMLNVLCSFLPKKILSAHCTSNTSKHANSSEARECMHKARLAFKYEALKKMFLTGGVPGLSIWFNDNVGSAPEFSISHDGRCFSAENTVDGKTTKVSLIGNTKNTKAFMQYPMLSSNKNVTGTPPNFLRIDISIVEPGAQTIQKAVLPNKDGVMLVWAQKPDGIMQPVNNQIQNSGLINACWKLH